MPKAMHQIEYLCFGCAFISLKIESRTNGLARHIKLKQTLFLIAT